MPMKLLSADAFRDAAKVGEQPDATVFRFATAEPQNVEGATRTKRFVFSDASIDHAGDSIDAKGWDLGVFKRNPVALFSHLSWEPPIGRASNVQVQGDTLVGDIEFASADVYEFADTIFKLVDGGFLNAVSVGFKPKEWAFTNDKNRPYGIDFKKQTLLEISVCPVPCNPNALTEARSVGIDTAPLREWAEKVLDNGDTVFLPKKELETLRGQASEHEAPRYYIQASENITADQAERIRDTVKRWQADPSEVLVLGDGLSLRTIGEQETPPVETVDTSIAEQLDGLAESGSITADVRAELDRMISLSTEKAGRRVSAATKAKLAEAMSHHEAAMACHGDMAKCIKDLMDGDGPDSELGDDPDNQPPGTVVTESDENLSPEERRLKEARALKATLPTNE